MHLKDGDTAADHELGMLSVEKSGKSIVLIMSQKSGHVPVGTSWTYAADDSNCILNQNVFVCAQVINFIVSFVCYGFIVLPQIFIAVYWLIYRDSSKVLKEDYKKLR